jgi:prolyl oligopeptidase
MNNDPHMWLEAISNQSVDAWIDVENKKTLARLTSDPRFKVLRDGFENELKQSDQLLHFHRANIILRGDELFEIYQNEEHPRGLLRKATLIKEGLSDWIVLLDVDQVASASNKDWYIHSFQSSRFSPSGNRILINFMEGGSDAQAIREFDFLSQKFIDNGFNLPVNIQSAAWLTEDSLVIASPLSESEKTIADYPRIVRLWQRGQTLIDAKVIYEIPEDSMMCNPTRVDTESNAWVFIVDAHSLGEHVELKLVLETGDIKSIDLPKCLGFLISLTGALVATDRHLLIRLFEDWSIGDDNFTADSLIAIDLDKTFANNGNPIDAVSLIYKCEAGEGFQSHSSYSASKDGFIISVMSNVNSKLIYATPPVSKNSSWTLKEVSLPEKGWASLPMTCNPGADTSLVLFENFTSPATLFVVGKSGDLRCIRKPVSQTGFEELITEQRFTSAKDGPLIPYYIVRNRQAEKSGDTPALLYVYGNHGTSVQPQFDIIYFGLTIRNWLKNGGALIVANPRGGGEYGRKWHTAAQLFNKQRTYDDIYSICEDIFSIGLTSPQRLGMLGGSGGGLTVGVVFTQRPELSNATISVAGWLDLLRIHKLGQGAFCIDEFGNPENPEDRKNLVTYSPYHNIAQNKDYYEPFFMAATLDDRVHPGHVRKMVEKMKGRGRAVLYYEARKGGHMMAVNNSQRAFNAALQTIYLLRRLVD